MTEAQIQAVMAQQGVDHATAVQMLQQSGAPAGGGTLVIDSSTQAQSSTWAASLAQAGQQEEMTIPVWRDAQFKRPVKDVDANGKVHVYAGSGKVTSPTQFAANAASTQFGVLLADQGKMAEWAKVALKAGGLGITPDNVNDAAALGRAWDTAVSWAISIKAASNGNTEVTPFEAAKMVASVTGSELIARQKYAADHFTGNRSSTTTNIDQSASSQTGDVLRQMLGRNPTAGEQAAYQHGINKVAAENPKLTTSVDTVKDGKVQSTVNTTTGGYDEQAAAIQSASSASPEVARNQQATTFYDALVRAVGAAV